MKRILPLTALLTGIALAPLSQAFDSGSTGADGAFNPTVSTVLDLPPDGIFNFTDVNIPAGVTVTFNKNATNTPVVMLASGDVTIAGTLSVAGGAGAPVGAAGDGSVGDDGLPGEGGPGGFDGGQGGAPTADYLGGNGLGPGGGQRGKTEGGSRYGGAGGSFGTQGNLAGRYNGVAYAGPIYGSDLLLPLIGGSGGGGGVGGNALHGSGGGGGGGAILLSASGTVTITGELLATGGNSGDVTGGNCGARGGGGAGGGIRVVASTIAGDGTISSAFGNVGARQNCSTAGYYVGYDIGYGGHGRVRLEAETLTRTAASTPAASIGGQPGELFVAGLPTLRIASVAGVQAPASPTGVADIALASDTPNPVTVGFETTGIPVGNIVSLTLTPAIGVSSNAVSNALSGTTDLATASTSIDLPVGPSTLQASVTYTITLAMAESLKMYAGGEKIERVKVLARQGGGEEYFLITESGREVPIAAAHLASAG